MKTRRGLFFIEVIKNKRFWVNWILLKRRHIRTINAVL